MSRLSSQIDFQKHIPERIRGVYYNGRVNWEALEMVVDTTVGTELEKARFKKQFFAVIKKHGPIAMRPWFRYHYCQARMALGDFSDYYGWECRGLEEGKDSDEWASRHFWENTWMNKWGGVPVERLLVVAEAGIGDMIFLASIFPECLVRAKEVVVECDERLHGLFERSFPRLKCKPETHFEDRRDSYGKIDCYIPAMDLMRMFRRDVKHFPGKPYLKPDPKRVAEMEKYRGRVGVAWWGRQGSIDPHSLGLERPLSLQYKHFDPQIEKPEVNLWSDLDGIVALCSVLERVVTVPQSAMHFAGAVGAKVEVIEPEIDGAEGTTIWDRVHRYNDAKAPWYRDCRFFKDVAAWKHYREAVAGDEQARS